MTDSRINTRRNLDELRTLYQLNPAFCDIIVEGRTDAALVRYFLKAKGLDYAHVYAVDDRINVPRHLVSEVHPENNARGRVIAAAAQYSTWETTGRNLIGIIDSDYDLLNPQTPVTHLLRTDYASMDVYGLLEGPLSKFLAVAANSDVDAESLVESLKPAWIALYCVRYVLHHHNDGARIVNRFADRCIRRPGEVLVEVRELLRTASPSPSRDVLEQLLIIHQRYAEMIPSPSLHGIRGHDIAPLIIRFLGLRNELADERHIEQLLRMSINIEDLADQGLFRTLRERLSHRP